MWPGSTLVFPKFSEIAFGGVEVDFSNCQSLDGYAPKHTFTETTLRLFEESTPEKQFRWRAIEYIYIYSENFIAQDQFKSMFES